MQQKLFCSIMRHKLRVVLLLSAITVFLGAFAARVEFDNTIESYFLESDLRDYDRFLDQFGTDEIIVVAFGGEDIFTVENFELIDIISQTLEEVPHVRRVISLTTAEIVSGRDDVVDFESLTPRLPSSPEELARIRSRAFVDPIVPGTLVSRDGRNTAIVAEIDHIIGEFDYKVDLLRDVRAIVAEQEARTRKAFFIGGTAVLDDAVFRYTQRDQTQFFPIMMLLLVSVMYATFRRVATTLLPLVVVIIAVIWTYGFMSLVGYKINIISTIIGPLLIAVGIADSMHIIADYQQQASVGNRSPAENIECSFYSVLSPCVMTSVTTILGLLSLLMADLVPIRQFGIVAAVGVGAALIVTVLLLPILLAVIPVSMIVSRERIRGGHFTKLLAWLGAWHRGRALVILIVGALAVVPMGFSLSKITVGTNSLDYFRTADPVRMGTQWIDGNIGGTTSLEFIIEAHAENALTEPALLEKMESFQVYMKGVPGITKVYSVTDVLKTLNRAFHGGEERAFRIPDSASAVAQELLVVEGSEDLDALLSQDRSRGRITARVAMNASRELAHRMPEVEARMREIFGETARVSPTGIVHLMHRMEGYLLSSQIKSFLLAFIVVSLVMMGVLRSFKLGVLAMIPNLLPILFVLASMPVLKIALDVGTVMLAGVALGLVVDDTTHFLFRLKEEAERTTDTRLAIAQAMNLSGRPIVLTSVVLSLGFLVLAFASFTPVIHFGILASMVTVLALVCDLVVLPALVGSIRLRL